MATNELLVSVVVNNVVKTLFVTQFDNVLIGKLQLVSYGRFRVLHSRVRLVDL